MFKQGVQAELNRLKWELELREKEAESYADALKDIRKAIVEQRPIFIDLILSRYGI